MCEHLGVGDGPSRSAQHTEPKLYPCVCTGVCASVCAFARPGLPESVFDYIVYHGHPHRARAHTHISTHSESYKHI